ncbi:hypothetical protein COT29_03205 [Candidatus Micrarchaeota archaeon CG08_land_8_20_14_0_20_59_11]|nr:MAG: hypothetical protein COT29_03205 [Candidatus Micrarchaeota archaeon CG08_land_8_20_14_0_20_59_11]
MGDEGDHEVLPLDIPEGQTPLARLERVLSSMPVAERKRVIVFIGEEPFNWEMAHNEIKNGTPLGQKIAEKLERLKLI